MEQYQKKHASEILFSRILKLEEQYALGLDAMEDFANKFIEKSNNFYHTLESLKHENQLKAGYSEVVKEYKRVITKIKERMASTLIEFSAEYGELRQPHVFAKDVWEIVKNEKDHDLESFMASSDNRVDDLRSRLEIHLSYLGETVNSYIEELRNREKARRMASSAKHTLMAEVIRTLCIFFCQK
jgi:exonuclease VII large subunit